MFVAIVTDLSLWPTAWHLEHFFLGMALAQT